MSIRILPAPRDPVNPPARTRGCFTSSVHARTAVKQQREHALGQAAFPNAFLQRSPHQLAGAGMSGMRLEDHRVAGRECGRHVPSGNRKCQRKVAGAKHHHRTQRSQQRSNIGLWRGLALWIVVVDARLHPRPFFRYLRKQPKLSTSARSFPLQPRQWQRRLQSGALDHYARNRFDLRRNRT
jgi:hypothetical protein